MKRKEKESLIEQIGMKFDEATALFSDETLESMAMNGILGGANADGCVQNGCDNSVDNTKNCVQNGCKGGGGSGAKTSTPSTPWWVPPAVSILISIISKL